MKKWLLMVAFLTVVVGCERVSPTDGGQPMTPEAAPLLTNGEAT